MATNALKSRVHSPDRLNYVHVALAVLSSVIGILIPARRINFLPISCPWNCQELTSAWYSTYFEFFAVALSLAGLVFVLSKNSTQVKAHFVAQGVCAIAAFTLMMSKNGYCPLCLGLQFAWFASALSVVFTRLWSIIPLAVGSLSLWVLSAELTDNAVVAFRPNPAFEFRDNEPMTMKGSLAAYAIFTDPLCPACRSVAKKFYSQKTDVPVIYRWKPLPQHGDDAIRYSAALESALRQNFEKGMELVKGFCLADKPTDGALIAAGVEAGFSKSELETWLATPDPASLDTIQMDVEYARLAGITSVPALRQVSTVSSQEPKIRSMRETHAGWTARKQWETRDLEPFEAFFGPDKGENK